MKRGFFALVKVISSYSSLKGSRNLAKYAIGVK